MDFPQLEEVEVEVVYLSLSPTSGLGAERIFRKSEQCDSSRSFQR